MSARKSLQKVVKSASTATAKGAAQLGQHVRKSLGHGAGAGAGGSYGELVAVMDTIWAAALSNSPEMATFIGEHKYDDRLSELTVEEALRQKREAEAFLLKVNTLFPESGRAARLKAWTLDQRVTLHIVKDHLESAIAATVCKDYFNCVHTENCPVVMLPMIVSKMRFESAADFEVYLKRLQAMPRLMEQYCRLLAAGLAERVTPPKVSVAPIPKQVEAFVKAGDKSAFHEPLGKLAQAGGSEQLRASLLAAIEKVLDAFTAFGTFVRDEYVPKLSEELCVAKRCAGGSELYAYKVRHNTTTSMSAREIHDLGLAEVKRIAQQMERIAKEEGFGSVAAYQAHLDDTRVCKTEEELLNHYKAVSMKILPKLPTVIGKLPRTTFGIRPVPDYYAPVAPAAYYESPPKDLSQAGWFSLNTFNLPARKTYIAEALILHEACPGHHLQIALNVEQGDDVPALRRYGHYTAYIEGWGLYAEWLGEEMGIYTNNAAMYGRLVIEMMRACRLVVDTGMNSEIGWSKERAMRFMLDSNAGTKQDIDSETTRYVAIPGQALSYKIGEIKLKELRHLAEKRLGAKFDVRKFHDLVLQGGSMPLSVLEEVVKDWLDQQSQQLGATSAPSA